MRSTAFVILISLLASCAVTKKDHIATLNKTQTLYYNKELTYNSSESSTSYTYYAENPEKKEVKGKFYIYSDTDNGCLVLLPVKDAEHVYFFPNKKEESQLGENQLFDGKTLTYWTSKTIAQAVSIPFKYRFRTEHLPYEVSTSFNAGFAIGRKFSRTKFHRLYFPNSFGSNKAEDVVSEFSLSPAGFLGLTPVALKSGNTQEQLTTDRTILGLTYGVIMLAGYNKFNTGISLGFDTPFGSTGRKWIYDSKPWVGFVVGFEFVK